MFKKFLNFLKPLARKNQVVEILAYLIQNNIPLPGLNTSGEGEFEISPQKVYERWSTIGQEYLQFAPFPLENKVCLEIGPGFSLTAAYFLAKEGGCKKVYAYDHFDVLSRDLDKSIAKTYFPEATDRVVYLTGKGLGTIPEKVDYIVSHAVLEHVWNMEDLLRSFQSLSHPETAMFHRIDFRNHNKFARFGDLYFLKFSDFWWNRMASKIGHPTRILCKEMAELFQKYGFSFEILLQDVYNDSVVQQALETYLQGKYGEKDFSNLKIKGVAVRSRRIEKKSL